MRENYSPCRSHIPIRGAENISKSRRDEGKGITLILSVMTVDGVIYATRLSWRSAGMRRSMGGVQDAEELEGGRQVVGKKNIHAWGDAEFSFSRW